MSNTNSTEEDSSFQSPESGDYKAEQPSNDPVSEIHSQLDAYSGPRDERALQQKLHRIEEQYSLPDSLDISEERHAQLEGKKREELAATREEFSRYQRLRREAICLDIEKKKQELFTWAREAGIPDGDILTDTIEKSEKPWEMDELIIGIDKKHYSKVLDWLHSSPNTKIDFSMAGRMAAYDQTADGTFRRYSAFRDFGFFERNADGQRVLRTHHAAFKEFAESRGMAIPSGEEIQNRLRAANPESYHHALATIDEKMLLAGDSEQRRLRELKEKVKALLKFIEIGIKEPKEVFNYDRGERLGKQETNYNDLVYNADDYPSEREWEEIGIPEEDRLQFLDGEKMETLCREFGEELLRKGVYR